MESYQVSNTSFNEDGPVSEDAKSPILTTKERLWAEVKVQFALTVPLALVWFSQVAFQLIAIMFTGHLGELALSSSGLATSITNAIGICVMAGMSESLETLCGQAFGAKQYKLLGLYTQTGIVCLNALAIVLSVVYYFTDDILIILGQNREISHEAGKYIRCLIPSLFAHASAQPLIRFLQTQSKVYPLILCTGTAVAVDIPLTWFLVYKTSLGFTGAALSVSICMWVNAILLYAYVTFSPSCSATWAPPSLRALRGIRSFLALAVPAAGMVCLEWWCYEILVFLSGLLPNPQLNTSTFSTSLNIAIVFAIIPLGLSSSVSTRVSNELGAGHMLAAYNAVRVAVSLVVFQGCVESILVLALHRVLGHLFSSDLEVVQNVAVILQMLAFSSFVDSIQIVLSGVLRGCGKQVLGSVVNLGSFYMVGLPVGACLAFLTPLQTRGLWIGVICAPFLQSIIFGIIVWMTDWDQEVERARENVESSTLTFPLLL